MIHPIGRALLGLVLCAAVPALAQPPNPLRNVDGVPYSALLGCDGLTPVSVSNPVCVTGAGGGGGTSATAAANGTVPVTAGTNKPPAIDLFSSTPVLVKDTTGAAIDWTAPVPVTQSGTWALGASVANIGDVDVLTLPALPTGANTIGLIGNTSFAATQATAASLNATVVGSGPTGAGTAQAGSLLGAGIYNTSLPSPINGQQVPLQVGARGGLNAQVCSDTDSGNCVRTQASGADASANGRVGLIVYNRASAWNGTTWDLSRGDTTGMATSPYGLTASKWNYAAAANGILNTTTAVTIRAAAGTGVRNCIANIDLMAEPLGTATELLIRDGAAGTPLYRTKITTAGIPAGRAINIPAAVCGSVNTLLEVVTLTASGTGAVYVNVNGNTAP